jgi:hypothetical protein
MAAQETATIVAQSKDSSRKLLPILQISSEQPFQVYSAANSAEICAQHQQRAAGPNVWHFGSATTTTNANFTSPSNLQHNSDLEVLGMGVDSIAWNFIGSTKRGAL